MLRGERVVLRPIEREDIKVLQKLYVNVELVLLGNYNWTPIPIAVEEHNYDAHLGSTDRNFFVIEIDGVVVGDVGLHHRNRKSSVSALGIGIYHPEYVGKGYGREALELLLGWAFEMQNYERLWLTVVASNERAIKLYQRLGFVEEARLRQQIFFRGEYQDEVWMGLLRDDWRAATPKEARLRL